MLRAIQPRLNERIYALASCLGMMSSQTDLYLWFLITLAVASENHHTRLWISSAVSTRNYDPTWTISWQWPPGSKTFSPMRGIISFYIFASERQAPCSFLLFDHRLHQWTLPFFYDMCRGRNRGKEPEKFDICWSHEMRGVRLAQWSACFKSFSAEPGSNPAQCL